MVCNCSGLYWFYIRQILTSKASTGVLVDGAVEVATAGVATVLAVDLDALELIIGALVVDPDAVELINGVLGVGRDAIELLIGVLVVTPAGVVRVLAVLTVVVTVVFASVVRLLGL